MATKSAKLGEWASGPHPSTADVLRVEAKKVLMANHEPFEDFLDYVPAKQLALADIHANRHSVEALNRVFGAYSDTITT